MLRVIQWATGNVGGGVGPIGVAATADRRLDDVNSPHTRSGEGA